MDNRLGHRLSYYGCQVSQLNEQITFNVTKNVQCPFALSIIAFASSELRLFCSTFALLFPRFSSDTVQFDAPFVPNVATSVQSQRLGIKLDSVSAEF